MTRRQKRTHTLAALVGLAATAAVVGAYGVGWLDWLELKTLDLRFRYANSIPQSDRIVCIDIDDGSLATVGLRWPWPRDVQAALVSIPAELGAEAILVDLTWVEPEPFRTAPPEDADIVLPFDELAGQDYERVLPDLELRAALAASGHAHLAVHYDPDAWEASEVFRQVLDAARGVDTSDAALVQRFDLPLAMSAEMVAAARVALLLESDPTRDESGLASELRIERTRIGRVFERCRQFVLRDAVRAWLSEDPARWETPPARAIRTLYAGLTPQPFEDDTPLKRALIGAYRYVLGYEATTRVASVSADQVSRVAAQAGAVVPVYYLHAQAARRCGFVTFETDSDGVMRRTPLLVRAGDRVLPQLAFGVAGDVLDVRPTELHISRGHIRFDAYKAPYRELAVQVDDHGRTMVPWVRERRWDRQFKHIPADALWQVSDRRRMRSENARRKHELLRAAVSAGLTEDTGDYLATIDGIEQLRRQHREAQYRDQREIAAELSELIASYERASVEPEQRLLSALRAPAARQEEGQSAESHPGAGITARALLADIEQIDHANADLQREIDETLGRLRPKVAGKICLIGYTATSLADMTPIPTHPRAPGVIAHANLLNGLLTGRTVTWAHAWTNFLLAMACGLTVTVISMVLRPREAALFVLALLALFAGLAGWLAFARWTHWIALTPALGAMTASYFAIAVYRYIFVDRERRHLATALGQYTSKQIARQVAENTELCRRAETREVSVMFTDLRGFTTISERIGAERTQRLLNVCLGRFTEVMHQHEAMVNKFIGDGIFAFWNPVIYAQPDHARRACETALDLLAGLRALLEEQRKGGGDAAFQELVLRIGLATGSAVVGPCGSEQKYDYTCIGDSVNVAARLESANKFFGTQILVNGATRAQVGEQFEFRALGGVQVKGKATAVPVYELLGQPGVVPDDALEYARTFAEAVTCFQARDWTAARAAFGECERRKPEDLAAQVYASAAVTYLQKPPGDDWRGAIELTEK